MACQEHQGIQDVAEILIELMLESSPLCLLLALHCFSLCKDQVVRNKEGDRIGALHLDLVRLLGRPVHKCLDDTAQVIHEAIVVEQNVIFQGPESRQFETGLV